MYISGINGYLSIYEGAEVDAAVGRVQGLDSEFALKVDKTTKINGIPLKGDIVLTAEELGAMSTSTPYGKYLEWENGILYLYDQNGVALSSKYLETDTAKWGRISGVLADQQDLQEALDNKQNSITLENMLDADLVDDTNSVHKFADASQLSQIGTNKEDIESINSKIPSQASVSNQLADKAFVNSTIQTATANFRGNWATWESVPTNVEQYPQDYEGDRTPTVNDYLVVQDASGYPLETLEGTWRFKYTGNWTNEGKNGWLPEYQVNEVPLTAAQLAALNSGVTAQDVPLIRTALQPDDLGDGTITIMQDGVQKGVFTTNQSGNTTIELEIGDEAAWGNITGDIENQTDLKNELDSKQVLTKIFAGKSINIEEYDINLPPGYSPMQSAQNVSRNAYINTGFQLSSDNPDFDISVTLTPLSSVAVAGNWSAFQIVDSSSNIYGIMGDLNEGVQLRWGTDGVICSSTIPVKVNHTYEISLSMYGGEATLSVTDVDTGESDSQVGTYTQTATGSDLCLWYAPGGVLPQHGGTYIKHFNFYNGENFFEYYPCNNSNGQGGFYDTANEVFKGSSNSGLIQCAIPLGRKNYTINFDGEVSTSLESLTDVTITSPSQGQNLVYDAVNNKWINASSSAVVGWGGITGNINDQTDLKNALDGKSSITIRDWSTS